MENDGSRRRLGDLAHDVDEALDYKDWRRDAAREGPFSAGSARANWLTTDRLDAFLGLPTLVWTGAVRDPDLSSALWPYLVWGPTLIVWGPWILWRVYARNPPGDVWRAAAILAFAWLPWPLAATPIFDARGWLLTIFVLVYGWGLAMMYLALRREPPAMRSRRRMQLMGAASMIYGAVGTLALFPTLKALADVRGVLERNGDYVLTLIALGLLTGGLAWLLAAKLVREALRLRTAPIVEAP